MKPDDITRLTELRNDTRRLRQQLERLNSMSVVPAAGGSESSGGSGSNPVERIVIRKAELERQITENESSMHIIIFDAPSDQLWKVMRLYFVKGFTWQQVAEELGYAEASGPKILVSRYFKKSN